MLYEQKYMKQKKERSNEQWNGIDLGNRKWLIVNENEMIRIHLDSLVVCSSTENS